MEDNQFKVIHERARLMILVSLAESEDGTETFSELKKRFSFTAGNLSIQLRRLSEEGFVETSRQTGGRRPQTKVRITEKGRIALFSYIDEMEKVFDSLRKH